MENSVEDLLKKTFIKLRSILYEMERESEMEYAKEEAKEEGREEERQESIRFMLSLGIEPEVIGQKYGMRAEEVLKLGKES